MAMTKAEAAKLTQDMMLRGVTETIVKESRLLQLLPFMDVTGTAVTYNREASMPAVTFYDVGDTWT
ncbi:MAG TPA: phage major capsid protein, partial [Thermomicrobiales bacterium]|nr:phage major capsid protein [Thermomicrobiales bacterium]